MLQSQRAFLYVFFLGATAVLIILHYVGALIPIERSIYTITLPTLRSAQSFSVQTGTTFEFFRNRSEFFNAYASCVSSSLEMAETNAHIKLLQAENDELKQELHFENRTTSTLILAHVVSADSTSISQSILIDRGIRDGVVANQPVIVNDGILIGTIAQVSDSVASVRLINDIDSKVAASVLNQANSRGVIESGFGLSLRLSLIPRDEIVRVGDQVVTSGLETAIPRGLLIGQIAAVENEPYQPFQTAIVTPAVDLHKLTIVGILEPHT